jgi:methionyl-tRNA formyltransferase
LLALNPAIGILNLHTGLSPYIKGGPNCTNWCIATNQFHLIGNTVMWIDKGIDTGNLVATEATSFSGSEDLFEIHQKVMEHAHQLYIDVLMQFVGQNSTLPDLKQESITGGTTYYGKQWNARMKQLLLKNLKTWKSIVQSESYSVAKANLKLVSLTHK